VTAQLGRRALLILAQVAFLAFLLFAWQLAIDHGIGKKFIFGTPLGTWARLQGWLADGSLLDNLRSTMTVLAIGYVLGTVAGVVIGLSIGLSRMLEQIFEPFAVFFNSIPRLIFQPFFAVWLGFGLAAKVSLVLFVIVFLVMVSTAAGVKEVSQEHLNSARALGARPIDLLSHVYIPAMTLWITASARTTVGYAFQAAVVSEFIGANEGLGYLVVAGQANLDINTIWAALAVMLVAAIAVDSAFAAIEARASVWMTA
jgi:ABC-type nitrate/sulfonate/bicarbonate transport system permease component